MTPTVRSAWTIFLAFALTYFLAALLRAITATLAPVFSDELALGAAQLGLLAGAYFLGFAAMQLPVGAALDRYGPKRTILVLLTLAVVGCISFALARSFSALVWARLIIGIGVAACLMAPLTCYRRIFDGPTQLRANSWMLMTGSLGMVTSTLPVQWLEPLLGWRGLFWLLAGALGIGMLVLAWLVPADTTTGRAPEGQRPVAMASGYRAIASHPVFIAVAPLGFFLYGGMIAVQTLWAGPWMTRVAGWTAPQAAGGLFWINVSMLLAFLLWGAAMPRIAARGWTAFGLLRWATPLPLAILALNIALGAAATAWAWALWCVSTTAITLSQPALGRAFEAHMAGRALSAYNLVIFAGVFVVQWGIGAAVDTLINHGWDTPTAFRSALAGLLACCGGAYVWFLWCRAEPRRRDDLASPG